MAVGDGEQVKDALAITSTGSGIAQTVVPGVDSLTGVSCPETGFCVAVGVQDTKNTTNTVGLVYDEGQWGAPTLLSHDSYGTEVSCASRSFCVATGYAGSDRSADEAFRFENGHWAPRYILGYQQSPFISVSCTADGGCVVVDGGGHSYRFSGQKWTKL
ncbi:MAG TPA: hypothetical protein VFH56_07615, partial [Acidimicrobiales bacterium]|nr:hypothetical protein [Acidimicrobiales bacterium]